MLDDSAMGATTPARRCAQVLIGRGADLSLRLPPAIDSLTVENRNLVRLTSAVILANCLTVKKRAGHRAFPLKLK